MARPHRYLLPACVALLHLLAAVNADPAAAQDPFHAPASIALRRDAAARAATALQLPPALAEALADAAAASEVNDEDAAVAINTTARGAAAWSPPPGQLDITIPGPGAPVPEWAAAQQGQPVTNPASAATAAAAAAAQPIPPQNSSVAASQPGGNNGSSSSCCARLLALGFRSNLPVVVVDVGGKVVPVRSSVTGRACTCGAPDGVDLEDVEVSVKVRGSSSAVQMYKKTLGLTFKAGMSGSKKQRKGAGEDGEASKDGLPFLGMPSATEWVLYGDDLDPTLGMRNALALDVARAMGGAERWAPAHTYCEVFLIQDNATTLSVQHYRGAFLAMDKIELGPHRINVKKASLARGDLSGGYLLGYERSLWPSDVRATLALFPPTPPPTGSVPTAAGGLSAQQLALLGLPQGALMGAEGGGGVVNGGCPAGDGRQLTYVLHEPQLKGANRQQQDTGPASNQSMLVAWASSYLASVEAAVVNDTLPAAASVNGSGGWRGLLDHDAFIDHLLLEEVTKNPDFARGSVYMHKAPGGKLIMGPGWDFNEAWGSCCGYPIEGYQQKGVSNGSSGGSAISPEGWRFDICDEPQRCRSDPIDGISLWWRAAWAREPAFRTAVARRWQQLRQGDVAVLSDAFFESRFQSYVQSLAFAAPRNRMRWAEALQTPSLEAAEQQYSEGVRGMEAWAARRVAWMDAALALVLADASALVAGAPELAQPPELEKVYSAAADCADRVAQGAMVAGLAGGGAADESVRAASQAAALSP